MKKGQKLYSILRLKCPHCHQGDLFINPNPYNYKSLTTMPVACSICEQRFEPEPGFYFGAMFVSYALTVAFSIAMFVAMIVLWHFNALWFIGINGLGILVIFPIIFRVSRAIWFNVFVSYEPNAKKQV